MFSKRRLQRQHQVQQVLLRRNGPISSTSCPYSVQHQPTKSPTTVFSIVLVVTILIGIYYYIVINIHNDHINDYSTHSNSLFSLSLLLINGTDHTTALQLSHNKNKTNDHQAQPPPHRVAGLSCQTYGGPTSDEAIQEMIYWYNIPSDSNYYSDNDVLQSDGLSSQTNNTKKDHPNE
jgi:hypothetical protein